MASLQAWFAQHPILLSTLAASSVVMFVGTLLAVPWLIARLPEDYLVRPPRPLWTGGGRGVLRLFGLLLLNLLGGALVLAGIAMLVLPGQGLLTLLVGLSMTTLPGKRRLLARLASVDSVHRAVAWMRRRAGQPDLQLP